MAARVLGERLEKFGSKMSAPATFSASEIARALGCSRQNIHSQLAGIAADGEKLIAGNLAKAWMLDSLPASLVHQLSSKAEAKGYRTITLLLSEPFRRFEAAYPLPELAPAVIHRARKLRDALQSILPMRNDRSLTVAEFTNRGLRSYQREFGHPVSAKHWRALLDRTVERDNGAEEWDRLDLYVEENPARISGGLPISLAHEKNLEVLEDALATLQGNPALSIQQNTYLWTKSCYQFQVEIGNGASAKKAKRLILQVLVKSGYVGRDFQSIRRNFDRKWKVYTAGGRKALVDRRTLRSKEKLPAVDVNIIAAKSLDFGANLSRGWGAARESGELTPETDLRYASNSIGVPSRIRREVTPIVRSVLPLHKGEKAFVLSGPYAPGDYSKLDAGEMFEMDDVTPEHVSWDFDESPLGYSIYQGQLIVTVDVRTFKFLGLRDFKGAYHARGIRSSLTRVAADFGIPNVLHVENGLWRRANVIVGNSNRIASMQEFEEGLSEFMEIRHAKTARGKSTVERLFGELQILLRPVAGWCGKDMRADIPEGLKRQIALARSGKLHPSEFCLNRQQFIDAVSAAMEKHNSTPRRAGRLNGLSPNEAWDRFQPLAGRSVLGAKSAYLMAYHREPFKIAKRMIRKTHGREQYVYHNEHTAAFDQRTVLLWWHPDELDSVAFTTLDRKEGPFVVPVTERVGKNDPTSDAFLDGQRSIAETNAVTRSIYRSIQPHLARTKFRPTYIDRATVETGERLETGVQLARDRQRRERSTARKVHSLSRKLNIRPARPVTAATIDSVAAGFDLMAESRELRAAQKERKS